jgi:hypothetical protein
MRRRPVMLAGVLAAGLALGAGITSGPASAAVPAGTATKVHGVAGYHLTVRKNVRSLTVQAEIKVPGSSCGSGAFTYSPEVAVQYVTGHATRDVSASLVLGCYAGLPVYGDAVLVAGSKTKDVPRQLKAGEVVTITLSVRSSGASVKVTYPDASATLRAKGGRPAEVQFAVALPSPPRYSPVRFSGCKLNGRKLAHYKPAKWESVTSSGRVDGKVSALSHGTNFSVSR